MAIIQESQIEIRLSLPDDFSAITEIRQHSLVAPQQYRVNRFHSLEIWLARLNADISTENFEWRTSSILFESSIVGYISEFGTHSKKHYSAQLGWNLHPDYWGRGIMTNALTRYISKLFLVDKCHSIVADCFVDNERCLRLLDRLEFKQMPIGRIERFLICLFRLCPHRIVRHRISAKDWKAKLEANNAE